MTLANALIDDRYQLLQKIGQGAFGKVYRASDKLNPKTMVAIKTEEISNDKSYSHLLKEINNCKAFANGPGYPNLIGSGISLENNFLYMVTDLLGPTIEDLFRLCG